MKNPNDHFFARRPEIRITAKSRDGHILAVKNKNFPEIPPGGELAYGDEIDPGEKTDSVTFDVTGGGFEWTVRPITHNGLNFVNGFFDVTLIIVG